MVMSAGEGNGVHIDIISCKRREQDDEKKSMECVNECGASGRNVCCLATDESFGKSVRVRGGQIVRRMRVERMTMM